MVNNLGYYNALPCQIQLPQLQQFPPQESIGLVQSSIQTHFGCKTRHRTATPSCIKSKKLGSGILIWNGLQQIWNVEFVAEESSLDFVVSKHISLIYVLFRKLQIRSFLFREFCCCQALISGYFQLCLQKCWHIESLR